MTTISKLQSTLQNLPDRASEAVVDSLFIPLLLEALGFQPDEIYPQYPTGNGKVDKAARKNYGNDIFIHTKSNPNLLLELKGRDCEWSENSTQYQGTIRQLKAYMLSPNCQTAQWGIITNSCHIQLFRKHGKVIYPATKCHALDRDNIDAVVASIRKKIENPNKALTVAVYNNKGGVGKTTTTVNLSAILASLGKRVLAIDFDPNQQDLTSSLGLSLSEGSLYQALDEKNFDLKNCIKTYTYSLKRSNRELRFDVIPADAELLDLSEDKIRQRWKHDMLNKKLAFARQEYDYIFIDSPPNWRFYSQLSVYAADVVLIPTKHNNLFSLENAATAIKKFIPEVQDKKDDGSPIALPIFFNGEKITPSQLEMAQKTIAKIILDAKQEGFNLLPYFYPRYTNARKDLHVAEIPSYANIASAAFSRIPAVYRSQYAYEYYKSLVKEYFLQ